jgi:hypothetical protein
MAATIADMQRRLQILEATSRVGLNRVRFAWSTHAVNVAEVSTIGAWETGPATATWTDDRGTTGTGYPSLTLTTGTKVLIIGAARYFDMSEDLGTAASVSFGVGIDGSTPLTWPTLFPRMMTSGGKGPNADNVFSRLNLAVGRSGITPGSHTFSVQAFWNAGAGATQPDLSDIFLAIVPLD